MLLPPLPESMYARRLLLVVLVIAVGLFIPVLAAFRVGVPRGEQARSTVEDNLVLTTWLPTSRGQILDRKGRVLAADRPMFDLAVDYPVITGQWAFAQAARKARLANKVRWKSLSAVEREAVVQQELPAFNERLEKGWQALAGVSGVPLTELEQRRSAIIAEVTQQAATVWERQRLARAKELERGRELAEDVPLSDFDSRPIREQTTPHVLISGVDDRTAFEVRALLSAPRAEQDESEVLPGLRLIDTSSRVYPLEEQSVTLDRDSFPGPLRNSKPITVEVAGVGTMLTGTMRSKPFKEDMDRRPRLDAQGNIDRGFYRSDDGVGALGIEQSAEDDLRGLRGLRSERLDTGELESATAQAGRDVTLTIDIALQARITALASAEAGLTVVQPWHRNRAAQLGAQLPMAAVVLDIDSGDVLAMVSTPSATRTQLRDEPEILRADPQLPLLNRAIARPYPPGSIVKPLLFAAAVTDGVIQTSSTVDCTGHFFPNLKDRFRCWIYKPPTSTTHTAQLGHHLDASEALMVSCNIYFYTVGAKLGAERITSWYERFGCGVGAIRPRLGVGDQFTGAAGPQIRISVADEQEMLGTDLSRSPVRASSEPRRGVSQSEATLMGIGQGPVAWTPLHAADAYCTLARYGQRVLPRLRVDQSGKAPSLNLDAAAVNLAMAGLERAVGDELGTGHHITVEMAPGRTVRETTFNITGVRLWGKSGTADSGLKASFADGTPVRDGTGAAVSVDHSWFVVLVGPWEKGRPTLAVAVLVENGGSGGRVAGPLCNQILWALRAEGYL